MLVNILKGSCTRIPNLSSNLRLEHYPSLSIANHYSNVSIAMSIHLSVSILFDYITLCEKKSYKAEKKYYEKANYDAIKTFESPRIKRWLMSEH